MYRYILIPFLFFLSFSNSYPIECDSSDYMRIFVSPTINNINANNATNINEALNKYKEYSNGKNLCLLFQSNTIHSNIISMRNPILTNHDSYRDTFGFIWSSNNDLIISTYEDNNNNYATLYSGKYSNTGPQTGLAIVNSNNHNTLLIENIIFNFWEIGAIFLYKSSNIIIRNTIIERIGTRYFPDETAIIVEDDDNKPIYSAGALYIKDSKNITLENVILTDIHNNKQYKWDSSHALYIVRSSNITFTNSRIERASGSPIKLRRKETNNIFIKNNVLIYTSPAKQENVEQEGWIRFSGKKNDCPSKIVISNNIFQYPYCWNSYPQIYSNCKSLEAVKYSESNPKDCSEDNNDDDDSNNNIQWFDNEFKYDWN